MAGARRTSEISRRADQRYGVGRAADNDLILRDRQVSRHHALLWLEGGRWFVRDLQSRHGTSLNGQPMVGDRVLNPGDQITIGDSLIVFDDAPGDDGEAIHTTSSRTRGTRPLVPLLIGECEAISTLRQQIARIAPLTASVLITGESGTGKEVVAQLLHLQSPRRHGPFVVVNCPALPTGLMEYELFGVEKRVATGVDPRPGRLESADGGTLFLDEIGDLESSAQAKLLRFLQEKQVERIGGREPITIDVRVVAATNIELKKAVAERRFRLDLYHRLNSLTLELPPLRERPEDIPLLVAHFIAHGDRPDLHFDDAALERLLRHDFPGNVRELERIVIRACAFAEGNIIVEKDLPRDVGLNKHPSTEVDSDRNRCDEIYGALVTGAGSFWELVREPFLRRTLSLDDARAIVTRGYSESGDSLRHMARLFHIYDRLEYKKLTNFLRNHAIYETRRSNRTSSQADPPPTRVESGE